MNIKRYEIVIYESGRIMKVIKTDNLREAEETARQINSEHNRGERTDYARVFDPSKRP